MPTMLIACCVRAVGISTGPLRRYPSGSCSLCFHLVSLNVIFRPFYCCSTNYVHKIHVRRCSVPLGSGNLPRLFPFFSPHILKCYSQRPFYCCCSTNYVHKTHIRLCSVPGGSGDLLCLFMPTMLSACCVRAVVGISLGLLRRYPSGSCSLFVYHVS